MTAKYAARILQDFFRACSKEIATGKKPLQVTVFGGQLRKRIVPALQLAIAALLSQQDHQMLGKLGGLARARKYTKKQKAEWGRKGGRPRKLVR